VCSSDLTEGELSQLRQTVSSLERRQKVDALLSDAEAVDFEVARLLTEAAVEAMDEPDVAIVVEELRRSKPYLFRRRDVGASAMGPKSRHVVEHCDEAAAVAAQTGDRRDLLRYLRLRRNGELQAV